MAWDAGLSGGWFGRILDERNGEVDELVFDGDAGVGGAEVVGVQGDDMFGVVVGSDLNVSGVSANDGEEVADHAARNKRLVIGEVDVAGTVGPKAVAKNSALLLDIAPGGVGGVGHVAEELLGTGTGEERLATTEVIGEAEGMELVGELVTLFERLVGMEDFCIGKTKVEFAEILVTLIEEVVGIGEDVVLGGGVGFGEHRTCWGSAAEVVAAGEMVDGKSDEGDEN